jgi:hypothetical protein
MSCSLASYETQVLSIHIVSSYPGPDVARFLETPGGSSAARKANRAGAGRFRECQ